MKKLESADRALRMLQAFEQEGQRLSVSALAASLGVHRSSASRLAATLAERGFLQHAPGSEAFQLGPEVARLGLLALAARDLVRDARLAMEHLAAETGESVVLCIPGRDGAVDIAQVDAPHIISTRNWMGRRTALHATSDGKVLLAFAAAQLDHHPLEALTERTIANRAQLQVELERVRRQGWAAAIGELENGLNGAAAPIFDSSDRCVAALSVSGPAYRVLPERLPDLGRACREAALEISFRLGYTVVNDPGLGRCDGQSSSSRGGGRRA